MGTTLRLVISALITLFVVFVVSMLMAPAIGLGPGEFWILPAVLLAALGLVMARRHRTSKQHPPQ